MGGDTAGHLGIGDLLWVYSFRALRKKRRRCNSGVMWGATGLLRGIVGRKILTCPSIDSAVSGWLSILVASRGKRKLLVRGCIFELSTSNSYAETLTPNVMVLGGDGSGG